MFSRIGLIADSSIIHLTCTFYFDLLLIHFSGPTLKLHAALVSTTCEGYYCLDHPVAVKRC
jgi:hypothetical protein